MRETATTMWTVVPGLAGTRTASIALENTASVDPPELIDSDSGMSLHVSL